jgi:hypothetical protein
VSKSQDSSLVVELFSLASLHQKRWWPYKSYSESERFEAAEAHDADPDRTTHGKVIINTSHPAWKRVTSLFSQAGSWFARCTFDWPVRGQRMFYREDRDEIWSQVESYNARINLAAVSLDAVRDELIEDSRRKMGKLFDVKAFPDSWAGLFSLTIREHSITPPEYLKVKDAEAYFQEMQQVVREIEWGHRQFEQECSQQLAATVGRMLDGLDGSGRGLSDNIAAFQKVFNRVSQMRFEGTQSFTAAMEEFQELVDGVDVLDIRKRKKAREETKQKLTSLLERHRQLQELIRQKGKDDATTTHD